MKGNPVNDDGRTRVGIKTQVRILVAAVAVIDVATVDGENGDLEITIPSPIICEVCGMHIHTNTNNRLVVLNTPGGRQFYHIECGTKV
ncbi:MAG: hypothetical protein PHC52_00660 [Syntrophales bacterium]|nr:hypothetical protein [Syntrophales bacterium]